MVVNNFVDGGHMRREALRGQSVAFWVTQASRGEPVFTRILNEVPK